MAAEPMTLIAKLLNPQRDSFDLLTMAEAAERIKHLEASELAWKIMCKHKKEWAELPQTEKEAALSKALDDTMAELEQLRASITTTH